VDWELTGSDALLRALELGALAQAAPKPRTE